ncbi:hypothetical protein [Alkalitalea saponilacus]|uniref:Uncharacterized protein n=1 Tax=Alkalitalea saponilacus TaxID=889453 RepID=A0A1T5CDI9_9BACT|nr:hypothetical protein [Alkalitalea saponilacus]ASB49828.1 hypothetical protein CDL62_12125 [Alkalitalea saponilacus]SKB57518.1 hypothetical protein SAMN03080601_00778 [Alkalitalea saponilacus]
MIQKLQIPALVLAASFLLTEAGKGLHFVVYHLAPAHNEHCHHQCDASSTNSEEDICVFSQIQFFPASVSEPSLCCKPFIRAKKISSFIEIKIYCQTITFYHQRGPPPLFTF